MNLADDSLQPGPTQPGLSRPELTHIGGPTLLMEYAGLAFLTDPTFDAPGDYPMSNGRVLSKLSGPAVPAEQLGRIDVVLLSHDQHPDNLDKSGRELLPQAGAVLGTPAAAGRIDVVRALRPWEQAGLDGGITATAVPALHGPEGAEAVTGEVTGFVLEAEGWPTVYVSGDNASLAVAAEIARRFPDTSLVIAFAGAARTALFDGAPLTLTSEGVVELLDLFPAATVVPVHTEGWAHFSEGPEVLRKTVNDAGAAARVALLPAGTPHRV